MDKKITTKKNIQKNALTKARKATSTKEGATKKIAPAKTDTIKKQQLRTEVKKKAMLQALEKTLGIVTQACKLAGISRDQHFEWLKKDEKYAADVDDLKNIALDFAESKLHVAIQKANVLAIIYYLNCKGKERGYSKNAEGFDDDEKTPPTKIIFKEKDCRVKNS